MAVVLAASPEAGLWQALVEVWIAAAETEVFNQYRFFQ
jgi:hypothetical protein